MGGLSHESACKVAYFRGQYAAKLAKSPDFHGSMMSVGLSETAIAPYLEQIEYSAGSIPLVVACINSPVNVTVSGNDLYIDQLRTVLEKELIFARKLLVNVAYHSPQMNTVAADYLQSISKLDSGELPIANTIMISSVTGQEISRHDVQQSEYWVANLTSPVRFSTALAKICSTSSTKKPTKLKSSRKAIIVTDLLEIGPHSALQGPVKALLKEVQSEITYTSVLVRKTSAVDSLLEATGRLHCYGYSIDISKANDLNEKGTNSLMTLSSLPPYPFDHSKSYWLEGRRSKGMRYRKYPRLDLLGAPVPDWNPLQARWSNNLRVSESPWIEDHRVMSHC
jgi:acyl transferase domain-containing protein